MAQPLPPIPNDPIGEAHSWREWFRSVYTVFKQCPLYISNSAGTNTSTLTNSPVAGNPVWKEVQINGSSFYQPFWKKP